MSAAEFNTDIFLNGTEEELLAMLSVIVKNNYLSGKFKSDNDSIIIYHITNDELRDFVSNADGKVRVEGIGPFGGLLQDCSMFEEMAEAAPNAEFSGNIFGGGAWEEESLDATLENGVMHVESFYRSFEDKYALLKELLPFEELCKILKIEIEEDDDDYDDYYDCYHDYLMGCGDDFEWDGYRGLDYFRDADIDIGITEEEFDEVVKTFPKLEDYSSRFTTEWDYDPVKKEKIKVDPSKKTDYKSAAAVKKPADKKPADKKSADKKATDKKPADKKTAVKASANAAETFARKISPAPASIEFEGKIFVHTNCKNEKALAEFITGKGGEVKSSTVAKTDYIIIGDKTAKESSKITKAIELNTDKGKNIIAVTESEFIKLTGYGK